MSAPDEQGDRRGTERAASDLALLVRLARLLVSASQPAAVLDALAVAAVDDLGASAAAVFEVTDAGELVARAARGLPADLPLAELRAGADAVGPELEGLLVHRADGRFPYARTFPLVVDTDLFGALVLLHEDDLGFSTAGLDGIGALVDLAAIALDKAHRFGRLERAYAELRASREVLARSEKLRSLGQMAAGVSHDLLNLLNPLRLQTQLLRRRADRPEAVREVADQIEHAVRFGIDTVDRLRQFSRQEPDRQVEPAELDPLVSEAVALCQPRLRPHHRLEVRAGGPPAVRVEAAGLVNAVVNLVANAVEVLPDGGSIAVATGRDGEEVWLAVSDSGPGMPLEIQQRIFEPFFTTKGEEGTGLGLAMTYAFVQRHRGRIAVESAPGRGTTFRLSFPLGVEAAAEG